jgi:hypothetical protein
MTDFLCSLNCVDEVTETKAQQSIPGAMKCLSVLLTKLAPQLRIPNLKCRERSEVNTGFPMVLRAMTGSQTFIMCFVQVERPADG